METTRPPGFPGNPPARMPRAPTPAKSPPPRPLSSDDVAFRPTQDVGPRNQCISGLNHAAYELPVNASRPGSPQAHASLGSGWRPTLAGWDWIPTGFRIRFRRLRHVILSPLTGLFPAHALVHLKDTATETLATIKVEADKAIQGAQDLAEKIEARARRTASQISVKEAQNQFREAAKGDEKSVRRWWWTAIGSVGLLVIFPLLFTRWELPAGEWPVALYHTLLRLLVLSAIAGTATFAFRMLRAHLHLAEKNKHRVRVANSVESFVQSALEPAQRDLILARLVDSIVIFGDSGLVQHDENDRSSPMSGDVIGRIVAAISSKGSS